MTDHPSTIGNELDKGEARSLLAATNHGVLSLGAGNRGYGHPISYRYEADDDRVIIGLVANSGGKTETFVEESEVATLTVYDYEDVDSWESVIVTGSLDPLDGDEVSTDVAPIFFARPGDDPDDPDWVDLDQVDRDWYALPIDEITGRRSDPPP